MNKSKMMLAYEEETGLPSTRFCTDGIHINGVEVWHYDYIAWLENKAAEYDEIEFQRMLIQNR
jgi:hypothetical protein